MYKTPQRPLNIFTDLFLRDFMMSEDVVFAFLSFGLTVVIAGIIIVCVTYLCSVILYYIGYMVTYLCSVILYYIGYMVT
jgi:hypothetical protein